LNCDGFVKNPISALRFIPLSLRRTVRTPHSNRVFKNKHQAVSQGVRRFGKRSIFIYVSIYKSRTTPDHGLRRGFSTPC
jgi:hypothetical protein